MIQNIVNELLCRHKTNQILTQWRTFRNSRAGRSGILLIDDESGNFLGLRMISGAFGALGFGEAFFCCWTGVFAFFGGKPSSAAVKSL